MIEIFLDNKNGKIWDITNIVTSSSWKTSRIGKPGSLEFTLIKDSMFQDSAFTYNNGDVIQFLKDGTNVFYGYIFGINGGRSEAVSVTCYDQIRYLMAKETYALKNVTADEVIRKIAGEFNLKLGRIDATGYRIPTMSEDGQTLIDIICKALDLTLINGGQNYFLFDDYGALSLRKSQDLLLDFVIGEGSLMHDYSFKRSIDSDTYNLIKLYKEDKDTGKRETYRLPDAVNIARWGVLQLCQSVDKNMNKAQIKELLDTLLAIKNRETKALKIDAIGDIRVRAGCYVPVVIPEYSISQPFIVEECTHNFDGEDHTMSLELKVI